MLKIKAVAIFSLDHWSDNEGLLLYSIPYYKKFSVPKVSYFVNSILIQALKRNNCFVNCIPNLYQDSMSVTKPPLGETINTNYSSLI